MRIILIYALKNYWNWNNCTNEGVTGDVLFQRRNFVSIFTVIPARPLEFENKKKNRSQLVSVINI